VKIGNELALVVNFFGEGRAIEKQRERSRGKKENRA